MKKSLILILSTLVAGFLTGKLMQSEVLGLAELFFYVVSFCATNIVLSLTLEVDEPLNFLTGALILQVILFLSCLTGGLLAAAICRTTADGNMSSVLISKIMSGIVFGGILLFLRFFCEKPKKTEFLETNDVYFVFICLVLCFI